jgi:hypothetical protein
MCTVHKLEKSSIQKHTKALDYERLPPSILWIAFESVQFPSAFLAAS